MAVVVGIISAVSRQCTHSVHCARLLRPGILRLNLRHFSCVSRQHVRLPSLQCISHVHSASSVQAKVNLWDEYNRVKSYVEGKFYAVGINHASAAPATCRPYSINHALALYSRNLFANMTVDYVVFLMQ